MATATSGHPAGAQGLIPRFLVWAVRPVLANLANVLTAARLLATGPILFLLLHGDVGLAFWIFLAAALTDVADGFIAKHFSGVTQLGAVLDPAADKLLVACLLPALAFIGALPLWLALLAIARDCLIVGGSLLLRWRLRYFKVEPLVIGKLCTFGQLLLIGCTLADLAGIMDLAWLINLLVPAAAFLLVVSAAAYIGFGLRLRAIATRPS